MVLPVPRSLFAVVGFVEAVGILSRHAKLELKKDSKYSFLQKCLFVAWSFLSYSLVLWEPFPEKTKERRGCISICKHM